MQLYSVYMLCHIKDETGRLLCGLINPDPEHIGLVHGGINVADCLNCRALYPQLPDALPQCKTCGYHHEAGSQTACAILRKSGFTKY
jgi:hypothetical protein